MKTQTEAHKDNQVEGDMLPDYSEYMKNGVRGKYVERFAAGAKFILLEPDVAAAFPDAGAVNEALRLVMKSRERQAF